VIYEDITQRDNATAPRCDFYMSGAPCPAFSAAGKGGGLSDPRGSVLLHSVDYVLTQRPRVACFENVKGLVNKNNRPVLDALVDVLRSAGYKCNARVLNTCTHGGIPHHRPRVYVVAVLKNRLQTPFVWPTSIPQPRRSSRMTSIKAMQCWFAMQEPEKVSCLSCLTYHRV